MKGKIVPIFRAMQDNVCAALSDLDSKAAFTEDLWNRPDPKVSDGGGGITRVFSAGPIIEKAGVNFSEVYGTLNSELAKALGVKPEAQFYATGTSLVIHSSSPIIPTVHCNVRYFAVEDRAWFGGGADLTPYYVFEEDCKSFHLKLKNICDRYDPEYYPRFKKWCDEYFYLPHRGEARGVGGLFFDYLGKDESLPAENYFEFVSDIAHGFVDLYFPIALNRREEPWSESQREFQLIRRGRYVEFNLLYDRGTHFGLKSMGRIESILMSLPPHVRWPYNYSPPKGSREEELMNLLREPREWV